MNKTKYDFEYQPSSHFYMISQFVSWCDVTMTESQIIDACICIGVYILVVAKSAK